MIPVVIFSCKKYEEGPAFSLKTIPARITGEWDVEEYLVDGADSTCLLKSNPCYEKLRLEKKSINFNASINPNTQTCTIGASGWWNLSEDKKSIHISFRDNPPYYSIQAPYGKVGDGVTWIIIKLSAKIMKLKTIYQNKTYLITLKKTKELGSI